MSIKKYLIFHLIVNTWLNQEKYFKFQLEEFATSMNKKEEIKGSMVSAQASIAGK